MILLWPKLCKTNHEILAFLLFFHNNFMSFLWHCIFFIVTATTFRFDSFNVKFCITWWEDCATDLRVSIPEFVNVLASPWGITCYCIAESATYFVKYDQNVVIYYFKEAGCWTCLLIIELLFTRGNNVDHIGTYDWVMNISVYFAWEEDLKERITVADSHSVNKDVTWHFHLTVNTHSNRCKSLPNESQSRMIGWVKTICKLFIQINKVKANTCHICPKSLLDLLCDDFFWG